MTVSYGTSSASMENQRREMSLAPNQSFLHGRISSGSERVVYATLDSLALKRTRFPLKLPPGGQVLSIPSTKHQEEEEQPSNGGSLRISATLEELKVNAKHYAKCLVVSRNQEATRIEQAEKDSQADKPDEPSKPGTKETTDTDNNIYNKVDSVKDTTDIDNLTSNENDDYERIDTRMDVDEDEDDEVIYSRVIATTTADRITRYLDEKGLVEEFARLNQEYVSKKKTTRQPFTSHVLHLMPGHLRRPKKLRKKKKSLSTSLNELKATEVRMDQERRSRSLSREELKYVTISSPTNFVHVASATSPCLVPGDPKSSLVTITHQEKCATVPLLVAGGEIQNENEKNVKARIIGPETFPPREQEPHSTESEDARAVREESGKVLARDQPVKTASEKRHQESRYELTANSSFLWSSRARSSRSDNKRDEAVDVDEENLENYDDIGPCRIDEEDSDYDDVGVPVTRPKEDHQDAVSKDSEDIYDDVLATIGPQDPSSRTQPGLKDEEEEEGHYFSISNEYSSVEEDELGDEEGGVYDDVGLPGTAIGEERVNSLYSGSLLGSNGKESEWEDLEDPGGVLPSSTSSKRSYSWKGQEPQAVQGKKKFGQRWSRQVRRQRSKGSRKLPKSETISHENSTIYVAVSLGRSDGSRLLLGTTEWIERSRDPEPIYQNVSQEPAQGLVQLRVIDLDEDEDTQETSCFVQEDNGSDDSTYESLHSNQPDDFSTDSEPELPRGPEDRKSQNSPNQEAPTRPTPPPPREASLTETLGRRIRMLRRTWSITKGSLGRIRRRTSVEETKIGEEKQPEGSQQQPEMAPGRYFSFSRHFRKNITGFSTFYLENNEKTDDRIYTNLDFGKSGTPRFSNSSNGYSQSLQPKENSLDHYSVLTEQEPLYQFYAAAAARVAFHSDSDGYEEVEDINQFQATTDLARPGQRTLWCQTPQVLNSGLLQRLTPEQRKVQEAKFEILTSEASYLNSLRVLENEFLNDPTLLTEILGPVEREKLFGSIPCVIRESEKFLSELEAVWRLDPMLHGLPDILFKYAEKCLEIYVNYCSNQVSIDGTLKELRARKGLKFLEAVAQIETRPSCQSLSLHSFLMLPMQRITRLPLLADAVLSKLSMENEERLSWERVLSSFSYVVTECNEGARAAAKEAEMELLAKKLEYSSKIKPIPLKGRHLVRSGPVVQLLTKADTEYKLTFGKKFNKTPLYLLLFTDYLLVTKHKCNGAQDESFTVVETCKRNLIALESIPDESTFAGRNAMLLALLENNSGHQVEYILTCESDTERQRWLEAVSPSKHGLVGETLYESWDCPQVVALYSYTPNQPDELMLQPGDVINVLRKMADGWYHGEKLLDGEQGWFPGNYTKEVASEHVRARNLKQRHRLLALSGSVLQRKAKQQGIC